MLTSEELTIAWGLDSLYRYPSELVKGIDIPEDAKTFLIEVGLPQKADILYGIYIVPLPEQPGDPPIQAAKVPLLSPYLTSRMRYLAYYHYDWWQGVEVYLVLEEGTGYIREVSPLDDVYSFVNSSVTHLSAFLLAMQDFISQVRPIEKELDNQLRSFESGRAIINECKQKLERTWQEIDPPAMEDPDNPWAVRMYDIKLMI